jgi:hypothetical protein
MVAASSAVTSDLGNNGKIKGRRAASVSTDARHHWKLGKALPSALHEVREQVCVRLSARMRWQN